MMKAFLYKRFVRFSYIVIYLIARALATVLYRFQVKGSRNIPGDKNLLVVARHISYLDPPLIGLALGVNNMVHFIARKGLLRNPAFALPVKLFSTTINREDFGKEDLRKIINALKNHETVCILPEGTTKNGGGDPKTGAIKFAEKTGKKFLPVRLEANTFPPEFPNLFPKIIAYIGPAFGLEELEEELGPGYDISTDRYKELSKVMMKKIDQTGK